MLFCSLVSLLIVGCEGLFDPTEGYIEPPSTDYMGLEDGAVRVYNLETRFFVDGTLEEKIEGTGTEQIKFIEDKFEGVKFFKISILYQYEDDEGNEWEEEIEDYYGKEGDKYYKYLFDDWEDEWIRGLALEKPISQGDEYMEYFEAEGKVDVEVPAGIFEDAWLIVGTIRDQDHKMWFVPYLGMVRVEIKEEDGQGKGELIYELIKFEY